MFGRKKKLEARRQQALHWATLHYPDGDLQKIAAVALILVEQLVIDFSDFTPASRFIEELHLDDLCSVAVVEALERKFAFEMSDEEAEKIQFVSDLITLICQKNGPPA